MIKKLHAAGLQLPVIMATAVLPPWEFTYTLGFMPSLRCLSPLKPPNCCPQ
jgi:hypothetical protein